MLFTSPISGKPRGEQPMVMPHLDVVALQSSAVAKSPRPHSTSNSDRLRNGILIGIS